MRKVLISTIASTMFFGFIDLASADPFKGMYMGGRAGYFYNKFPISNSNTTVTQSSIDFGPIAGMMTVLPNNLFFAGEVEADISLKSNFKTLVPGITGKIGYRMAERFVLAFTLGGVYSVFQFQPNPALKSTTKGSWGIRPGAELLFAINEHNIIGFTYLYTKNLKVNLKKPPLGPATFKPSSNMVLAEYIYKF